MRVLGPYVLVEQAKRRKHSGIIMKKGQEEWTETLRVLALGAGIPNPEIQIGEVPILSRNVVFQGVKVLESNKDTEIVHFIIHYEDIVGIDDPVGVNNLIN